MRQSRRNYQKELEGILEGLKESGSVPTLLLHSCCAPCSSYCLSYLADYFRITIFYYNPNISPKDEYLKRVSEQKRLIAELPLKNKVCFAEGIYEPDEFFEIVKGYEEFPEGSQRCYLCYEMRMRSTAEYAKKNGFDYFTSTLSISPHKNADWINEIGMKLQDEYGVAYLVSDFKKRGGYQKSIELSKEYNLYRQNYCGCVYSKRGVGQKEIWDVYDGEGMPTGRVMDRGMPASGDYMLCVHIYIYNDKGQFLVQKRAAGKITHPGAWDITVGAVLSGEESRTAAVRETFEEIGVLLEPEELQYKGRIKRKQRFADVYFVHKDFDLNECVLQKDEVEKVKFVDSDELILLARESRHRAEDYIERLKGFIKDNRGEDINAK